MIRQCLIILKIQMKYITVYRKDREIVFEFIKKNGRILEWANEEFNQDEEIVFEAAK